MPRSRTEIPDPRIACAGEQRISDQFVASPLADDGARDVTDVVLIETQHCTEARVGQRLPRAREPVSMETLEVDALFEIDLSRPASHQRPVPAVRRFEIVFVDG